MFRKSFKIKSNTRLKTTEKKKFRNDLLKEFPSIENFFSHDALNLKSNISILDIATSSGDSVKVYTAPLYPSFILYNGKYFPTVYMLWEIPSLVHNFTTHSLVIDKIKNGADLMLPGVVTGEPCSVESYGSLKKGDVVGINVPDNVMSIAVGEASMSSQDMFNSGNRGKCVNVIHFFGDFLSELAPSIDKVPLTSPIKESQHDKKEESTYDDVETIKQSIDQDLNISTDPPCETIERPDNSSEKLSETTENISSDLLPEDTMEDLLHYCFFKSLVTTAKKAPLPLLTNVFYKVHMMNVYPQGSQIDIKKSKYKKLSTFLDEMSKSKVITIEQNSNGIHKIVGIDYGHNLIKEFVRANPTEKTEVPNKSNQDKGPTISEKYCVNASVLPLFSKYSFRKGDLVTQVDIRKCITTYIKDENLQDDSDKRFVKPDRLLRTIVKKDVNSLTWEDIIKAVIESMGQSYQVNLPSNKTLSGKGKMPMIEIQVASRAGNKKVTLVNNLSFYGVNLSEFSKECQHGVAASTTINSLPHLKSEQVQIQGNQTIFIGKLLLEKYQIPKRFIRGLP